MADQTVLAGATQVSDYRKGADYLYAKYGSFGNKVSKDDYYNFIKAFQIRNDNEFKARLGIKTDKDRKNALAMPTMTKQELARRAKAVEAKVVAKKTEAAPKEKVTEADKEDMGKSIEKVGGCVSDIQKYANVVRSEDPSFAKALDEYALSLSNSVYKIEQKYKENKNSIKVFQEATDSLLQIYEQGRPGSMLSLSEIKGISDMMRNFTLFLSTSDAAYKDNFLKKFNVYSRKIEENEMSDNAKRLYFGIVKGSLESSKRTEWLPYFQAAPARKGKQGTGIYTMLESIDPIHQEILKAVSASAQKNVFGAALALYNERFNNNDGFLRSWIDFGALSDGLGIANGKSLEGWIGANYGKIETDRAEFANFRSLVLKHYKDQRMGDEDLETKASEINTVLSGMTMMDLRLLVSTISKMRGSGFTDKNSYVGLMENLVSISKRDPVLITSYLQHAVPALMNTSYNDRDMQQLFAALGAYLESVPEGVSSISNRNALQAKFRAMEKELPSSTSLINHKDLFYNISYDVGRSALGDEAAYNYPRLREADLLRMGDYFSAVQVPMQYGSIGLLPTTYNMRSHVFSFAMPQTTGPGAFDVYNRIYAMLHPGLVDWNLAVPSIYKIERSSVNRVMERLNGILSRRETSEKYSNDWIGGSMEAAAAGREGYLETGARIEARTAKEGGARLEAVGGEIGERTNVYGLGELYRANVIVPIERANVAVNYYEDVSASEVGRVLAKTGTGDMLFYYTGNQMLASDQARANTGWYWREGSNVYRIAIRDDDMNRLLNYQFGEVNAARILASIKTFSKEGFEINKNEMQFGSAALGFTAGTVENAGLLSRIMVFDDRLDANGNPTQSLMTSISNRHAESISKYNLFGKDDALIAAYRGTYVQGKAYNWNVELKYRNVPVDKNAGAYVATALGGRNVGGFQIMAENVANVLGFSSWGGTVVSTGLNDFEALGIGGNMSKFLTNVYGWKENDAKTAGRFAALTYMYSKLEDETGYSKEKGYFMANYMYWAGKFKFMATAEHAPSWINATDQAIMNAERQAAYNPEQFDQAYRSALQTIRSQLQGRDLRNYALGIGYDGELHAVDLTASIDLDSRISNMRGLLLFQRPDQSTRFWLEGLGSTFMADSRNIYADWFLGGGIPDRFRVMTGPTLTITSPKTDLGIGMMARGWNAQLLVNLINQEKGKSNIKYNILSGLAVGHKIDIDNENLDEWQAIFVGKRTNIAEGKGKMGEAREKQVQILGTQNAAAYIFADWTKKQLRVVSAEELEAGIRTEEIDRSISAAVEFANVDINDIGNKLNLKITFGNYQTGLRSVPYSAIGALYTYARKPSEAGIGVDISRGPMRMFTTDIWSWNYLSDMRFGERSWGFKGYVFYRF